MAFLTAEHIAMTQIFIDANPSQMIVVRIVLSSDGSGGVVSNSTTTLAAQTARLVGIEARPGSTLDLSVSRDGEMVVANSIIIGLPTMDLKNQDQVTFDGDTSRVYEVLHVENHPEWRRRAEVYLTSE